MRFPLPHSVTMHEEPVAANRKAPEVSKLCVGVIASSVYAEGKAAALLEAGHCLYLFGCYLMQRRAHEESEGQTRGILNDILHNAGINEEYVFFITLILSHVSFHFGCFVIWFSVLLTSRTMPLQRP